MGINNLARRKTTLYQKGKALRRYQDTPRDRTAYSSCLSNIQSALNSVRYLDDGSDVTYMSDLVRGLQQHLAHNTSQLQALADMPPYITGQKSSIDELVNKISTYTGKDI